MDVPCDQFWRHLLGARGAVSWGNFSWFSPRTLLLSLNDQVANRIENAGNPGSIIDSRRMEWVARQRNRGMDPDRPIRIPSTQGLLVIGDPGEMDASQYVLVRELALVQEQLRGKGINTALLMSDIVYPAGDVNAWEDAVYLPYRGLPAGAWARAVGRWSDTLPEDRREEARAPLAGRGPLRDWHLLGTPGNHDWYDGLNGFMYHACGAEPLAHVSYDLQGLPLRQRTARFAWRYPAPPQRERLNQLRASAPGSVMAPGMPNLPGPYYAVDIGCSGVHAPHTGHDGPDTPDDTGCALLRLVMVDNGITGSIDVDQADWIATMLRGPLPKVVVTGRPVVVNNKINRFTVAEDGNLRTGDRRPRDLISLMADGSNVVATLAGDVHNYQRFLLPATTETGDPSKLPPVQIVAGGGGAYLAATHHTRLDAHDALPLELKRAPWPAGSVSAAHAEARRPVTGPMKLTVDGGQHTRFPDREDSVRLFGARVHRSHALTSFVVTLIALLAGYGVLFWAGRLTDESPLDTRISLGTGSFSAAYLVVWPFLVLAYVGLLSGACLRINATVHRWPKRVILLVVLMVAIAVAWLAFRDRSEAEMRGLAIGLLEVAALLLAPFVAPLLRGFPRLGGKTLLALIGALFVLRCVQVLGDLERATELALAGIAYVAVVVGVWWYKRLGDLLTKRQFLQTGPSFYSLVHRVVPMALVVVPAVFFTLIAPREGAELVGIDLESDADDAIRMLSALTGLLLLTGILAAVYVVPARRAWRTIPRHALVVSVAAGALLVATVATFWLGERDSQLDWKDVVLLVVACVVALVLGLLLGLLVCQVMALALGQAARPTRPPDPEKVAAALRYRDVGGNPPDRSYRLAGAMITADVPSLESLAEASQPPFGKNILVLSLEADHEETRIRFDAYGLYDESPPERGCYSVPRLPPGATAPVSAERGLFAIDAVTLRRRHSDPEWEVV